MKSEIGKTIYCAVWENLSLCTCISAVKTLCAI